MTNILNLITISASSFDEWALFAIGFTGIILLGIRLAAEIRDEYNKRFPPK